MYNNIMKKVFGMKFISYKYNSAFNILSNHSTKYRVLSRLSLNTYNIKSNLSINLNRGVVTI